MLKNLRIVVLLFLSMEYAGLQAQDHIRVASYYLEKTSSNYSSFIDGFTHSLNNYSDLAEIELGFTLNYSGQVCSTIYCGSNGYAVFDKVNQYFRIYACRLTTGIEVESVVSAKTEGQPANRICKVQWENSGSGYDSNFQLWIYETGQVEIHLGKINLNISADNKASILFIGFTDLSSDIHDLKYIHGTPPGESLVVTKDIRDIFKNGLDGIPLSGTTYSIKLAH